MVLRLAIPSCMLASSIALTANAQSVNENVTFSEGEGVYAVSGKLTYCETSDPVPTATVHLLKDGAMISETWTSPDGGYEVSWISPGTYILRFEKGTMNKEVKAEIKSDLADQ